MNENPALQEKIDLRNAGVCVGAVAAAFVIIWPFADLPYGDDTTYSYIALNLARSGHLAYNGWQTALLLLHALWGALFIRIFGFSFDCLRLSTVPLSLAAVGLCYLLVRRAGLQAQTATFATLLFGLSPLFLPVAVSYMTDAPALFFMFASLYSFSRVAEASTLGPYSWLVVGSSLGFLGGTGRQTVWLVPLVVLPYLAWVRRAQKWLVFSSLAAWVLVAGGGAILMAWFNRQPYAVPQPSVFKELRLSLMHPSSTLNATIRFSLMLLLMCLPAVFPLLVQTLVSIWRGSVLRKMFFAVLLTGLLVAILKHPSLASIPWVNSTLDWEGINGASLLPGRPIVLIPLIRVFVAIAVYVAACILASELVNARALARGFLRAFVVPSPRQFTLVAMSLVSVVYFALILLRGVDFDVFDRYLLPLLPWAATVFLLWFDSRDRARPVPARSLPFAWALLAVLALYAIASTQDVWALARARASAARRLEAAGVSRTAIDGGFEYNAWTELLLNGHLNSRWVTIPPGAYRPGLGQTPSIVPLYRLEYAPTPQTAPTQFGSVPFTSFLPPFRKQVSIDRVLNP